MSTNRALVKLSDGYALDVQPSAYQPSAHAYVRPELDGTGGSAWREIVRVLHKHRTVAIAFALVVELAVAGVVFLMPNTYEVSSTIDVEPPGQAAIGLQGDASVTTPSQQDYIDTQIEILQGDGLALNVISALHLDQNPAFLQRTLFQRFVSGVSGALPWNRNKTVNTKDTERLLDIYHGDVSVGQVKNSRLIDVRAETLSPQLSAQVVDSAVQQYLEQMHRSKYEATLRAADSLSPELNQLKTTADQSTQAVLDFQKTHEGAELGAQPTVAADGTASSASVSTANPIAGRVAELNQQLTQAIADRLQQESYMKLIQQGNNDALPQMKDNALLQQLGERLADSRADLAQALTVYGGNNPQVRKLQEQTLTLMNQLDGERNRVVNEIKAAYQSAVNREQLIQTALNRLKGSLDRSNADVLQYDALRREADVNSNQYVTLSSQITQMAIAGSLSSNNIRVVSTARIPDRPSGPHRFRMLGAGLALAVLGGMGLAFVAEGIDDRIFSTDDIRRWSDLPVLAMVPKVSALKAASQKQLRLPKSILALRSRGMKCLSEMPNSPEAEAIRNLETVIRLPTGEGTKPVQTILITSAFAGEGKTTVAANLAMALARHGKTCLIDADMRHPAITHSFGLSLKLGLSDLLTNPEASVREEICKPSVEIPNLTVIGTGIKRPNASENLTSNLMRDLVDHLRSSFEYVIFDTPPIIPFSEARWLATMADGAVLVTRCSATTRRAVAWSLEILEDVHAPVLGLVLNGINLQFEYYSYGVKNYAYDRPL